MKRTFSVLALLIAAAGVAQSDGYWDNARATTKEIKVDAGKRFVVRTEDFPTGTTELAYRITLLDDNQQMANSLVSLLKAIPDPSGMSQGSAGAVFLLSKISGEDKCTYAAFPDLKSANQFKDSGDFSKACISQKEAVSKDARLLSADKTACLTGEALYFVFKSENWLFQEKIVLEVVPWVDRNLSRGWTRENRQSVIALCKTSGLAELMLHPDDLCLCILDKFQQKMSWSQYQKLLASEKSKRYRDFGNACLDSKTADPSLLATVRADATAHFQAGNYDNAIRLLSSAVMEHGNAQTADYVLTGNSYLYSKQYTKALQAFRNAEKSDDSGLSVKLGIAHALLLSGHYGDAKTIYRKYKGENIQANVSWIEKVTNDFAALKAKGIHSVDFDRILKLLKE